MNISIHQHIKRIDFWFPRLWHPTTALHAPWSSCGSITPIQLPMDDDIAVPVADKCSSHVQTCASRWGCLVSSSSVSWNACVAPEGHQVLPQPLIKVLTEHGNSFTTMTQRERSYATFPSYWSRRWLPSHPLPGKEISESQSINTQKKQFCFS